MKMSKAHFELIARVLARHAGPLYTEGHFTLRVMARDFADELARTNPAFDRERFLKACGVPS
jgi:hypothetical protein